MELLRGAQLGGQVVALAVNTSREGLVMYTLLGGPLLTLVTVYWD